MQTEKDLEIRDFKVIKDYGDNETFFRLDTEGGEVTLPKLPFQTGKPLPETLSCRIRHYDGNVPVLAHNLARYINDFYYEGFCRGQEFEFRVTSVGEGTRGWYRLTDDNGLFFKLHEPKTLLVRGQSVKCRFESMDSNNFILRRSTSDERLQMLTMGDIARIAGVYGVDKTRVQKVLTEIPEMSGALDEYDRGRSTWSLTAMRTLRQVMPRLFRDSISKYPSEAVMDVVTGYERVLMDMLQGSGYLRNVRGAERSRLQAEITSHIEQIDIYKRTLHIISVHGQRKFIDELLNNLKRSGYIYHPTVQFSIMMILFRMSPELVNTSLGNIFDTIMGWDLEIWKAEPFRQAFVEQLEIYISETREEIDLFLQAETPQDNETIERMLTAIAIQLCLANDKDNIDMRLNTSLFYRYISLLRNVKANVLLSKSYLTLMGVQLPTDYTWANIKEPMMMMTRAAVDPPSTAQLPSTPRYFLSGDISVEISSEGIFVSKNDYNGENIIPNGMLQWPGMKLYANIDKPLNRTRIKSLDGHADFWTSVEKSLFVPDADTTDQQLTKRIPEIDDYVQVVVNRVIPNAADHKISEAFECKIVDEHFAEGFGIMPAAELVSYNLYGVVDGTFRHDNGDPIVLEARVIDVDENDRPIFSLLDRTFEATRDLANVGDSFYCVVTKDNGNSYSAISERGFGLYVNKDEDDTLPPFRKGTVLLVSITGYNYDAVQSEVIDGPIDNWQFSNKDALHNLLLAIAENTTQEDTDMQIDEEDRITAEDMRELIQILRYKAVSLDDDIIASFDYLSFARILASITGDEDLCYTLKAQKELLLLHQYYAKNKIVYKEQVESIRGIAPDSIYVNRMAERLGIVSSLGHSEDNPKLWELADSTANSLEKDLARMVLSYNMLCDVDRENSTATGIKDEIAKKLNVSTEQRILKYYGSESQYVEFKSSLVYPARKGRAGLSLADPDMQEYEILHIIAGFLNTTGGTLYIGVNDDHYECGLADDFSFYKIDTSERNTPFRRKIRSLDNLANHLQNLIDESFSIGKNAGDYAKVEIDEESTKGVLVVKIAPCPHVVYLGNNIYVRHSAKTTPITEEDEIAVFKADRAQLYKQLQATAYANAILPGGDTKPAETPVRHGAGSDAKRPVTDTAKEYDPTAGFSVKTSAVRKNILHAHQDFDNFVTPLCYIRFTNDNEYVVTTDEWSFDGQPDRLVLTVTEKEQDGYLLLVYEGNLAVRVRIKEILEKTENARHRHYGEKKLVYASPVTSGDGLYGLLTNSKGTLYERVTPMDKISQGSMRAVPEKLLEAENAEALLYETIPSGMMGEMRDILSTGMKRTQIGALVKGATMNKVSVDDARKALYDKLLR